MIKSRQNFLTCSLSCRQSQKSSRYYDQEQHVVFLVFPQRVCFHLHEGVRLHCLCLIPWRGVGCWRTIGCTFKHCWRSWGEPESYDSADTFYFRLYVLIDWLRFVFRKLQEQAVQIQWIGNKLKRLKEQRSSHLGMSWCAKSTTCLIQLVA